MRIDIISAVPELLESPLNHSIIRRARDKGLVEIHIVNLHDYGKGNYKQIDDYGFGGDAGMVIKPEPLYRAITDLTSQRKYDHIIYTSPDGEMLEQNMCNSLSTCSNLIILCGPLRALQGYRSPYPRASNHQGDFYRQLRPQRRGTGGMCDMRFHYPPHPRSPYRRDLSPIRLIPRRSSCPAHLHQASRFHGLESPGSIAVRQP